MKFSCTYGHITMLFRCGSYENWKQSVDIRSKHIQRYDYCSSIDRECERRARQRSDSLALPAQRRKKECAESLSLISYDNFDSKAHKGMAEKPDF